MHWLVSQSLSLTKVTVIDSTGHEDMTADVMTCGHSCIAIIFAVGLGCLMILAVIATGSRRFKPGIPTAANCSMAISAVCHPPEDDVDASVLPVMWGVINEDDDGREHCTFYKSLGSLPTKAIEEAPQGIDLMRLQWEYWFGERQLFY